MNTLFSSQRGISLIEALVALVVISVGALSIARLHSNLVASSGLSKARSEAVQIAQGNNEQLRNKILQNQYTTDIVSGSRAEIEGINAIFDLAWTVSDENVAGTEVSYTYKRIVSEVTWDDATGDPQSVIQSTQIAWMDPRRSLAAASSSIGGERFSPTGKARMATGLEEIIDHEKEGVIAIDHSDGLSTLIDGAQVQLVSSDNEVIMTMETSSSGQGFSTISGRIYIEKDLYDDKKGLDLGKLRVLPSDASLCTRKFQDDSTFAPFEDGPYVYFDYRCYFGEGWYGNIGAVRLEKADNQHRFCVGDPTVTEPSDKTDLAYWAERYPALSTVRRYRGYAMKSSGGMRAVGIGMVLDDPTCDPAANDCAYIYEADPEADTYAHHDFLLTKITGKEEDSDCQVPLNRDASNLFSTWENPGKNFCMTGSCEAKSITDDPSTFIKGTITRKAGAGDPVLSKINIGSGACRILDSETTPDHYKYECETTRSGWTGETWSDKLILELGLIDDGPEANSLCTTVNGTAADYASIDSTSNEVTLRAVPITEKPSILDLEIGYTAVLCKLITTIVGEISTDADGKNKDPAVLKSIQLESTILGGPIPCFFTTSGGVNFYNCQIDWTDTDVTSWTANLKLDYTGVLCSPTQDLTITGIAPEQSNVVSQDLSIARNNGACKQ